VSNLVPARYREVAVASLTGGLDADSLQRHFLGREVYRRTRYVVARHGTDAAVVEVAKAHEGPLFSPVVSVRVLALPAETAVVDAPAVDTGVPTQLARAALKLAPGARCVVVQGRYRHVSFILDPAPIRVRVVEVVPPRPPKLLDQARRVLELAEHLPPVELVPELVDLTDLARQRQAPRYLLPCRGAGIRLEGTEVRFLDERPPRQDWVLLGCDRSRELHRWFYGEEADTVELCPRRLAGRVGGGGMPVLTKCCLLEEHMERDETAVTVPWGATLDLVRAGLELAVATAEPAWAPA
jgi:hypothetical protein